MARAVHGIAVVIGFAVAAAGCVIPPRLEIEDTDAGVNAPPVITETFDGANPLPRPASVTIDRAIPSTLNLTVYDVDVDDELAVRMFVDDDFADPKPSRVRCDAPSGSTTRSAMCQSEGLCQLGDVDGEIHRLEIEVYDRPPGENAPDFRKPEAPGLFSTWTLELTCINTAGG